MAGKRRFAGSAEGICHMVGVRGSCKEVERRAYRHGRRNVAARVWRLKEEVEAGWEDSLRGPYS
jgi:hypothetical protein